MTEPSKPDQRLPATVRSTRADSILGLSTGDLAGLSVDEVTGNKTAITMVMHYYKQLVDENGALKNDLNTLKTYVDAYGAKKLSGNVGAVLQICASIFLGFGINLLTTDASKAPGWMMLVGGLVAQAFGLYYSLRDGR